jgi:predicted nuclease with TOPRIM domain
LEQKIDQCLNEQRILISEREEFIKIIETGNDELKRLEAESAEFYKLYPEFGNNEQSSVILIFYLI